METNIKINKRKLIVRIVSLIFFIFLLNFLAMRFYWYFSIWYFDMSMHFLGGFWLGLVFIYYLKTKDFSFFTIFKIILGFLIIAISWEIFEILVDKTITSNPFNTLDTLSDICFGLAGMFTSILYFSKRIIIKETFKL